MSVTHLYSLSISCLMSSYKLKSFSFDMWAIFRRQRIQLRGRTQSKYCHHCNTSATQLGYWHSFPSPSILQPVHNHLWGACLQIISEITLAPRATSPSPPLQDVSRQGGGARVLKFFARGYCQRAQGRDGPHAPCFHGNIGGVMTASTATPSARDLVNDEKNRKRKAPQILGQNHSGIPVQRERPEDIRTPSGLKPKLSWGSTYQHVICKQKTQRAYPAIPRYSYKHSRSLWKEKQTEMRLQPSWTGREGAVSVTSNAAGGGLGAPLAFQQEHLHSWLLARHIFLRERWDYKRKISSWSQS